MSIDLSGAHWFKSSRSKDAHACVEVAHLSEGMVGVRDSKDRSGSALVFAPADWDAFTAKLADGEFDRS
ncbi:DUF397 domain-containing protein [Nocardia transvalensis]|uniref:DUF397 domain-containing protein n=1 Tax=Nocardia transvalensis TaxID=37333 RepID=UPI0018948886|nr:DUF397 domain-containing protein [Nocardia transvalensis]MBF6333882.1 DUF397 domain-containing protein [Nocardia transvalensis]